MKFLCLLINVVGGAGVLATYAYGIIGHKKEVSLLWGGIPESVRPLYGISMIVAAVGYLLCSYYVLFVVDSNQARVFQSRGYGIFAVIYLLILVPSMLWMPLTYKMAKFPNELTWFAILAVLVVVAFAATCMVAALLALSPRGVGMSYWAALVGSLAFCLHTVVLDAIIWPYLFR